MISMRISRNFVAYLCLVKSILTHGRASTIDNGDVLAELVWEFHHFCVDQLIPFN
jgi:hypothetical protein